VADAPAAADIPAERSSFPSPAPQESEQPGKPPTAAETPAQYQPAPTQIARPAPPASHAPDPAEIERALKESGLELVQTRPGVQAEPPPEPEFTPAKRERRPPPPDLDEPLVQVETGRESPTPKV
jgi:ribonuclease E